MRAIRFLLLLLMLAVMPFQSWAGARTCAVGIAVQADSCSALAQVAQDKAACATADEAAHAAAIDASAAPGPVDTGDAGDAKDPAQPGADLAESLLPASPLRFAAGLARSSAPTHRAGAMPDPDLPLQQRPPSA
ncbi:hypothetical protein RA280_07975 [Cupriavidus sp. CV2]|uniref:hypothetical protein n=1 Tax=Cupriavidus ulmosensis TaxID=3065913 RepID=UPI00296B55E0|nr:hypothetical protein [Cupriavidus sp. CV2]MDW3681687.1 hypothetical protein [Cupriavidus sp. CV2]